jgi:HEPN domain-containing protein
MTNHTLAASYILKARKRVKALAVLLQEEAFSDVVREAQEIVELCLKAALRVAGIDPPKIHDVGGLVHDHSARFPPLFAAHIPRLVAISGWLRKEREFAFCGDIDFIPTEQYSQQQAQRAFDDATFVVDVIQTLKPGDSP